MSIKVYVHYEEATNSDQHVTLKLTLPRKWVSDGSPKKVLELFVESYNKRKPGDEISCSEFHLENASGDTFGTDDIIGSVMKDRDDIFVKKGPMIDGKSNIGTSPNLKDQTATKYSKHAPEGSNQLRCRNYGCNQFFNEEQNDPNACSHHVGPPIFHDTKKGWSCCEKRVYDWDEFQAIPGCHSGPHSTTDPNIQTAPIPSSQSSTSSSEPSTQPQIRSIDDYNAANPDAKTAAKSAVKAITENQVCTRRSDGTAKCLNKGCQQDFTVEKNEPTSCVYHRLNPVFHDTGKYWACCPDKVKYDFDDFFKIEGCCVGFHQDGSGDFKNAA